MSSGERFEMNGTITQKLKGDKFVVELENGMKTTGSISGKLRVNSIRLIVGDSVTVDMSPYDLTKCRIIWRNKTTASSNMATF